MTPATGIRTPLETRTATAALLAGPVLCAGGVAGMLLDPDGMAGGTTGGGWGAALFGLAMFTAFCAVPQSLFGLALRGGRRGPLLATAVGAPAWAVAFGVNPLVGAVVGGFAGVNAVAVAAASTAAVLDGFVLAAAVRGLRRPGNGCDVGAGGLSSAGAQRQQHLTPS